MPLNSVASKSIVCLCHAPKKLILTALPGKHKHGCAKLKNCVSRLCAQGKFSLVKYTPRLHERV